MCVGVWCVAFFPVLTNVVTATISLAAVEEGKPVHNGRGVATHGLALATNAETRENERPTFFL